MRYAYVSQGVVEEAWSRDPFELFDPGYAQQFVSCPDAVQAGWTFDGTNWSSPPTITDAEQAAAIRDKRQRLLVNSDWTQLADSPADKAAWAIYRQALRDISTQPGFPWAVDWPVAPE
jgi:hypothetical protein